MRDPAAEGEPPRALGFRMRLSSAPHCPHFRAMVCPPPPNPFASLQLATPTPRGPRLLPSPELSPAL